jgi:pilus assembly protein Flp/PilA
MQRLQAIACRLAGDTRGATAIEYGLIAALIAIGMLAGLSALGDGASSSWSRTANRVTTAMDGN